MGFFMEKHGNQTFYSFLSEALKFLSFIVIKSDFYPHLQLASCTNEIPYSFSYKTDLFSSKTISKIQIRPLRYLGLQNNLKDLYPS